MLTAIYTIFTKNDLSVYNGTITFYRVYMNFYIIDIKNNI